MQYDNAESVIRGEANVYIRVIPSAEEVNLMTLQVGIVGKDGIVLASDRCYFRVGTFVDKSQTSKIIDAPNQGLIYMPSGDTMTFFVGQRIRRGMEAKTFDMADIRGSLEGLANTVYGEELAREPQLDKRIVRTLLLVFYGIGTSPQLWELKIDEGRSVAMPIYDRVVAGDVTNSVRFFSEAYFRAGLSEDKAKLLAAHIIISGHKVNRFSVDGLEIVTVTDTVHRYTAEETNNLTRKSMLIDAYLEKEFSE